MTFADLRCKNIVNVADGKNLGNICDIAISRKGKIAGIIVPGEKRFFRSSGDNLFIPWCNICKIGDDVILVELYAGNMPREYE